MNNKVSSLILFIAFVLGLILGLYIQQNNYEYAYKQQVIRCSQYLSTIESLQAKIKDIDERNVEYISSIGYLQSAINKLHRIIN